MHHMRMNFNIKDETYKKLMCLANIEEVTMTEIITKLVENYVDQHSAQIDIVMSATQKARNLKRSE